MKKLVASLVCLAGAAATATAGIDSIDLTSIPYQENFDSLTGGTWNDNSTLHGWYASGAPRPITTNNGNSSAAGLKNFGINSGAADRAFGTVGGSGQIIYRGAKLENQTGGLLGGFAIQYDGEHWRQGRQNNLLQFQYFIGDPTSIDSAEGGWTTVSDLNFAVAGVPNPASLTALDGNANAVTLAAQVNVAIGAGGSFWIRWIDYDEVDSDAGLGVDNLTVTAVVPEPSPIAIVGGFLGLCLVMRWRSRRHAVA